MERKKKEPGVTRDSDIKLGWVERDYPQLEAWRELAVEWMRGQRRGVHLRLCALVAFLERYIVQTIYHSTLECSWHAASIC